jgi:predicted PurR-regulated permease PerM
MLMKSLAATGGNFLLGALGTVIHFFMMLFLLFFSAARRPHHARPHGAPGAD